MKFQGACLTIILYLAKLGSAWDDNTGGLVLNKKEGGYFFPRQVQWNEDHSRILFKDPKETNIQTYLFCNSKRANSEGYILTGELLSDQNNKVSPLCPKQTTPIQPIQEVSQPDDPIKCGPLIQKEKGLLRRVYYKLHQDSRDYDMNVYEYCFDDNMKEMVYVKFTIENPQLLQNELLEEEQSYPFSYFALEDSTIIQKYEKNLYNSERAVGIPEFMPFALIRKAFHLYDSSAPLNQELGEYWNEFLLNIKKKMSKKTESIEVIAGVYDRKRVHGASSYLTKSLAENPSPYAYWVLLYNHEKTQGISLIMHNYAYDKFETRQKLLCKKSVCSDAGLDESIPNPKKYHYAMTYCCPASTIAKLYGFYELDDLIKF